MSNQENYVNNDDTSSRGAYSLAMLKDTGLTGAERLILELITKSGDQHGGLYFESAKMTALRLGLAIPTVRQVCRQLKGGVMSKIKVSVYDESVANCAKALGLKPSVVRKATAKFVKMGLLIPAGVNDDGNTIYIVNNSAIKELMSNGK